MRSAKPSRLLQDVRQVVHSRPTKTSTPQFVFYPLCSELSLSAGGETQFRGMPPTYIFRRSGFSCTCTLCSCPLVLFCFCIFELWQHNGQLWITWLRKPTSGSTHATSQLSYEDVCGFSAPTFDFCSVNRSLTMKQQSSVCGFGYGRAAKTAHGSARIGAQFGGASGTESAPRRSEEIRDHNGSSACSCLVCRSCARNFQNQDVPGSFDCFSGQCTPLCSGPFGPAILTPNFGGTTWQHCCCQCTPEQCKPRRPGHVFTLWSTQNQRFGTLAKPSQYGGRETASSPDGCSVFGNTPSHPLWQNVHAGPRNPDTKYGGNQGQDDFFVCPCSFAMSAHRRSWRTRSSPEADLQHRSRRTAGQAEPARPATAKDHGRILEDRLQSAQKSTETRSKNCSSDTRLNWRKTFGCLGTIGVTGERDRQDYPRQLCGVNCSTQVFWAIWWFGAGRNRNDWNGNLCGTQDTAQRRPGRRGSRFSDFPLTELAEQRKNSRGSSGESTFGSRKSSRSRQMEYSAWTKSRNTSSEPSENYAQSRGADTCCV